jgi:hypothetical protein
MKGTTGQEREESQQMKLVPKFQPAFLSVSVLVQF